MDGNFVTIQEHKEFARRIDDENTRQNRRISALEDNVKEIHGLTVSVERMAVNMENMLNAIERQGNLIEQQGDKIEKQNSKIDKQNEKIEEVKNAPAQEMAKDSKQIKMAIVTAVISAVVGAVVGAVLVLL